MPKEQEAAVDGQLHIGVVGVAHEGITHSAEVCVPCALSEGSCGKRQGVCEAITSACFERLAVATHVSATVAVPWPATGVWWCGVGGWGAIIIQTATVLVREDIGGGGLGGGGTAVQAEGGCPPCCCRRSCSRVALQSAPCALAVLGWCAVGLVIVPD